MTPYQNLYAKSRFTNKAIEVKTVVFPLPHVSEYKGLIDTFPMELIPYGIKDIAVCALENMHCKQSFVKDCFVLMEHYLEEKSIGYLGMFPHTNDQGMILEIFLEAFYDDFTGIVKNILGNYQLELNKIVSYNPNGALCVQINHAAIDQPPRY